MLATLLYSADATGKWKGTFDAPDGTHELTFDLKASGDTLTGAISGLMDSPARSKTARLRATRCPSWPWRNTGPAHQLVFKGQVLESEIHFTMGLDDGSWSSDLVVKRFPDSASIQPAHSPYNQ